MREFGQCVQLVISISDRHLAISITTSSFWPAVSRFNIGRLA
jgi:hypothetical protein